VEAIADEFIQFKRMHYQVSRGSIGSCYSNPFSSEEAAEHLADQVNRSVKGGAKYY
jgi:nitrous oxide reductase accessory protein NosL